MKTSTFERAMVQNAYTTPLRHEQLGGAHCPQCSRLGHACTGHSNQLGSTAHSIGGTAVGLAIIIGAVVTGYKSTKESTMRRTNKVLKVATIATAAFAAGGFAQRY